MALQLNRLSTKEVTHAKRPAKGSALIADGGGLYLQVTVSGAKSWVFVYKRKVPGEVDAKGKAKFKRTEIGLGSLTAVTLANARDKSAACRELLENGQDPKSVRKVEAAMPTFGQLADEYIQAAKWKNDKHRAQWEMTLTRYAKPIRNKPVNTITSDDVAAVLKPLWADREETADRLRGRIDRIFRIAKARKHITGDNPAEWKGNMEGRFIRTPKGERVEHHPSMPWQDVPAFIAKLRERQGVAALAVEFAILTAGRSGEVRGALWDEFDLDKRTWTIPGFDQATGRRMKSGTQHRVPLTDRMLEILDIVKPLRRVDGLVFPGTKPGAPLSDMSLTAVLRRMKQTVTVHGFRSSFRVWAGSTTSFPRELVEMALAHVIGNQVERAYWRDDALERRREIMAAWERYCVTPPNANVVPMRKAL